MNHYHNPTDYTTAQLGQLEKPELIKIIVEQQREKASAYALLKEVYTELATVRQQLLQHQEQIASTGYPETTSWISKIVFTLLQENRPLRSAALISQIARHEPRLSEHHNKEQYFSAFLSNAVSYGRVIQHKVKGTRGYYYLLPQWVDEQGKVKAEYIAKML